jgi:transcriptional regulator with XRE-family HTH domain
MADDPSVAGKVPNQLERACDTPERAFGAVITELRIKRGWGHQHVAHEVGCNPGYMNEVEHGNRNPSFKVLKAIADVHKIKLSQLFALSERKFESCHKKKKTH